MPRGGGWVKSKQRASEASREPGEAPFARSFPVFTPSPPRNLFIGYCAIGQDLLLSQCFSPLKSINGYRRQNAGGNLRWTAYHPGGVVILPIALCYRNRDKLRQLWATRLVKTLPYLFWCQLIIMINEKLLIFLAEIRINGKMESRNKSVCKNSVTEEFIAVAHSA